ncbi:MAG: hypothetical protein ABIW80_10955 [Lapillicoccus sp.]
MPPAPSPAPSPRSPRSAAALLAQVAALAALPGVAEGADAAREACTRLRFDEALRRRIPEAAGESRIRGAQASAALDGADVALGRVRGLVTGAQPWPERPDPVDQALRGVVRATAETEHVVGVALRTPLQALARLHVAAAADQLPPDQVGRPRRGDETARELVDLGPAGPAGMVADRLAGLAPLLSLVGRPTVPALVVLALVHAEIASVRPFVRGNAVVARAFERALLQASGLDPTGVAVPEVGHLAGGSAAYVGALAAYGTGSPAGVTLWLRHCADAVVAGAVEGERVCAAVRTGRLS